MYLDLLYVVIVSFFKIPPKTLAAEPGKDILLMLPEQRNTRANFIQPFG